MDDATTKAVLDAFDALGAQTLVVTNQLATDRIELGNKVLNGALITVVSLLVGLVVKVLSGLVRNGAARRRVCAWLARTASAVLARASPLLGYKWELATAAHDPLAFAEAEADVVPLDKRLAGLYRLELLGRSSQVTLLVDWLMCYHGTRYSTLKPSKAGASWTYHLGDDAELHLLDPTQQAGELIEWKPVWHDDDTDDTWVFVTCECVRNLQMWKLSSNKLSALKACVAHMRAYGVAKCPPPPPVVNGARPTLNIVRFVVRSKNDGESRRCGSALSGGDVVECVSLGTVNPRCTLDNLFFAEKRRVVDRIARFSSNTMVPPHTSLQNKFFMLLHGPPGTGAWARRARCRGGRSPPRPRRCSASSAPPQARRRSPRPSPMPSSARCWWST
jgi:hypothetical protein